MQRFFLALVTALPLAFFPSCSSSGSGETASSSEPKGAEKIKISEGNNPFAFSKEDIQRGADGRLTGGKRSQFESQSESAYAKANAEAPAYLQKDYHKKTWLGSRDYRTGSYKTGSYRDSSQRSRFSDRRSRESGTVARASGQDFSTGSYRTGSAREDGLVQPTGRSGYVQEQAEDGWRKIQILDGKEYRSISMGQAKSLLGR